jgi:hypothetical protein
MTGIVFAQNDIQKTNNVRPSLSLSFSKFKTYKYFNISGLKFNFFSKKDLKLYLTHHPKYKKFDFANVTFNEKFNLAPTIRQNKKIKKDCRINSDSLLKMLMKNYLKSQYKTTF